MRSAGTRPRRRGRLRRDLRPRRHPGAAQGSRGRSRAGRSTIAASTMEEMDVDAIIRRKPQVCVVDELAHTNVPGSRNAKRYEDVLEYPRRRHPRDDRGEHPAPRDAERRGGQGDRRASPRNRAGHVPRSRRRSDQRRRDRRGTAQPPAEGKIYRRRRSNRRSPTSSGRATCRRCASWRCARSPTKSARRPRVTAHARDWSRR